MENTAGLSTYCNGAIYIATCRYKGFYEFYRLGGKNKPDGEPSKKEELSTQYEGSHSLFGILWQIATATGWSVHYIMWKLPYSTIRLMLADAPGYKTSTSTKNKSGKRGKNNTLAAFQSRLQ